MRGAERTELEAVGERVPVFLSYQVDGVCGIFADGVGQYRNRGLRGGMICEKWLRKEDPGSVVDHVEDVDVRNVVWVVDS